MESILELTALEYIKEKCIMKNRNLIYYATVLMIIPVGIQGSYEAEAEAK